MACNPFHLWTTNRILCATEATQLSLSNACGGLDGGGPGGSIMDEGTLTPIHKCRLYWSFLFRVWKQFCRFWIWSETECKTPAEYGLQHNSTPPPQPHTVCIYCTFTLRRGGGHREGRGATVHKYSSFVHRGNSSQASSKVPTVPRGLFVTALQ